MMMSTGIPPARPLLALLLLLISSTTDGFISPAAAPRRSGPISFASQPLPHHHLITLMSSSSSSSSSSSNKNNPRSRPAPPPSPPRPVRPPPAVEWSLRRIGTNPAIELLESALEEGRLGGDTATGGGDDEGLFTAALKECRSSGDGKRALRYLGLMKERQMREIDFVSTIHACAAEALTADAISVFRKLARLKKQQGHMISFGSQSYVAVIMACSRGGQPEEALSFFQELGQDGNPPPDAACYAAMMETYRRYGRPKDALELLEQMKAASKPGRSGGSHLTLAATIRALTDLGRAAEAVETFDQACDGSLGVIPDGGCYAAVLEAVADLGDWKRALALIEEMGNEVEYSNARGIFLRRQLRVGRQHYVAALRACAKAGESATALSLLTNMRARSGVRPDEKCHRWALFACCQGGQWSKAMEMLLQEESVGWTLPCYTTTMRALVKTGEPKKVLTLWDLLLSRGLAPDAASGDIALSMAGKEARWGKADAIFGELQRRGLQPYVAGYGVVIEGRCQQGRIHEARNLLRQVPTKNVIMYTSILSALGRAGDIAGALALLQEMETKEGIMPDHVALTCLVDACLKAGAVEEASRLAARLEEATTTSSSLDGQSLGVRVRTLLEQGQWETAWRSIQEAEDAANVAVPAMSYSVLINAAAKEGRWRDAVEMLLHMRELGMEVSTVDLSSAINACRLGGEWQVALKLLEVLKLRRGKEVQVQDNEQKQSTRGLKRERQQPQQDHKKEGRGAGEKQKENRHKKTPQQNVEEEGEKDEEEAARDANPLQVSYGLVLDLLAKQMSSSDPNSK